MILFTPTVQHTGTHFLYAEVLGDFCTCVMQESVESSLKRKSPMNRLGDFTHYNIHTHFLDEKVSRFAPFLELPILIPMRHPARVYESWFRRKRKKIENCTKQFSNLINVAYPKNPMFLVIDHEDREKRLAEIASFLDISLKTDWQMGHGVVHETGNCDITDEMMSRVPDFVMDFYEEVK